MPGTSSTWYQYSPNTDGQGVLGPEYFRDTTGAATISIAGNVLTLNAGASTSPNIVATFDLFTRTGMAVNRQEQFGVSGALPFSGGLTQSDPDGWAGIPPISKANLPTLAAQRGLFPKGAQLNSLTVSYKVTTVALTSFTAAIYANQPVAGAAAPTQTTILASANNGLTLAASANIYTVTIPLTNQVMLTTFNQFLLLNFALVIPATGSFTLYGVQYSYNFNYN